MTIQEKITEDLIEAMKSRDAVRLSVVRDLKAGFVNELVSLGKKPDEALDDEGALKVVRRKISQRKESIEQFEKAGRGELAQKEKAELDILETYLPSQLSDDELKKIVAAKKESLGIHEAKDAGRLIGAVLKEVGARADGVRVKTAVSSLFSVKNYS
jgi:uncharacterized protein YqeY